MLAVQRKLAVPTVGCSHGRHCCQRAAGAQHMGQAWQVLLLCAAALTTASVDDLAEAAVHAAPPNHQTHDLRPALHQQRLTEQRVNRISMRASLTVITASENIQHLAHLDGSGHDSYRLQPMHHLSSPHHMETHSTQQGAETQRTMKSGPTCPQKTLQMASGMADCLFMGVHRALGRVT